MSPIFFWMRHCKVIIIILFTCSWSIFLLTNLVNHWKRWESIKVLIGPNLLHCVRSLTLWIWFLCNVPWKLSWQLRSKKIHFWSTFDLADSLKYFLKEFYICWEIFGQSASTFLELVFGAPHCDSIRQRYCIFYLGLNGFHLKLFVIC